MTSVLPLLLHLLVAFLAVATMLAILFPRRPLLGVPQHWGLQLWQLSLVAAIGGLLLTDWRALALSAAVTGYWSWRLWPRRVPRNATEGATPLLRIVIRQPAVRECRLRAHRCQDWRRLRPMCWWYAK